METIGNWRRVGQPFGAIMTLCALAMCGGATTPPLPSAARQPAASTGDQQAEGYVQTEDGTQLFYQKIGNGKQTVIIPGRLFMADDFKSLAAGRTLIFYDMRGRGRSAAIPDEQRPNLLSIHHDVRDVETIRKHFKVEKFSLIGYSYLGLMVVMYAMEHPSRVERLVQIGPVPLKFSTKYPEEFTNTDKLADIGATPAAVAEVEQLLRDGYDKSHPKEFCEKYWQVVRFQLVGNPANVVRVRTNHCETSNEWPVNLFKHFEHSFVSVQRLDIPQDRVKQVKIPVLTIHGTKDRNAPYGSGREWASRLPNARLLTVRGAAHQVWADAPQVLSSIAEFFNGKWPVQAEKLRPADAPSKQ